jgi:hypothetical protein
VTVWFLSKRVFSEGQAEDAILLGFKGLGQWLERRLEPQIYATDSFLPLITQMGADQEESSLDRL